MKKLVKLTFLGDVMCKAQMLTAFCDATGKYCFDSLFQSCVDLLSSSDYVFANLETPISYDNSGLTSEKYCFCSPYEFAEAVKRAGIDFVATANNHCLDRGIEGIASTIRSLDEIGLEHTGIFDSQDKNPKILDVLGLKIGVLAYTYGTNAFSNQCYLPLSEYWRVNLFQNQELSNPIMRLVNKKPRSMVSILVRIFLRLTHNANARRPAYERREFSRRCRNNLKKDLQLIKKEKPDLIIMCMHAGGQYNPEATEDTKKLASFLLRNGVNIVAGSHEHVVHGGDFSQISENKLATYSLGNFDGIAGIYEAPFDKMAEYSIALHVYVSTENAQIEKCTYSVLKTIADQNADGRITTVPACTLLEENWSDKLWEDYRLIVKRFSGKAITKQDIQIEQTI